MSEFVLGGENWPDRPVHPDFWNLVDVVLKHDGRLEDESFSFSEVVGEVIDLDSLIYMSKNRVLRCAETAGYLPLIWENPELLAFMQSIFIDAMQIGARFQERKERAQ